MEHSFLPMRFSCWTSLAVVLAVFLGFYEVSLHFCESDFAKLALFSLINCPWICINGPRVKEFAGELVSYGLKTCITRNSQPIAPRFHLRRFYLRFLYNSHKIFLEGVYYCRSCYRQVMLKQFSFNYTNNNAAL